MSNKKQTAVDKFHDLVIDMLARKIPMNTNEVAKMWIECKSMEREQIIEACYNWYTSLKYTDSIVVTKLPEEYYKETYDIQKNT